MDWSFSPMTEEAAADILQWRYPPPYDFYNCPPGYDPARLAAPNAFVCFDAQGRPAGTFSFGADGQIPTVEENPYQPGFLDIGLRLRPDLCGQGHGTGYIQAGLAFGREVFQASRFRLSVAAFNQRAIRANQKCGFAVVGTVTNSWFKIPFFIMVKESPSIPNAPSQKAGPGIT